VLDAVAALHQDIDAGVRQAVHEAIHGESAL
jgi:hypothetical protein